MSDPPDDRLLVGAGSNSDAPGPHAECAYVHDLTAGFAFGALEPDDHHRVDRHCHRCAPCERVVQQARETAAILAFAARPANPPVHVKAALFTRIAQSSQGPVVAFSTPQPAMSANPGPAIAATQSAEIGEARPTGRRRPFPALKWDFFQERPRLNWSALAAPLATVPLVLALAIVGGFALTSQSRLSSLREELLTSNTEAAELRSTLDAMGGFVAADDARVYKLPDQAASPRSRASGRVIVNPGTSEAMLLVWGMKSSSANTGYEIWLEGKGGVLVSAGRFEVDTEGDAATLLRLDHPFTTYEAVHVKPRVTTPASDSQARSADALVAQIDPNVGELLDTDPPSTR